MAGIEGWAVEGLGGGAGADDWEEGGGGGLPSETLGLLLLDGLEGNPSRRSSRSPGMEAAALFTLEAEEEVLPPEGKAELLWLVLLDFEGLGGGGSSGSSESESLKTQSCNLLELLNEAPWIWAGIAGKGATKRIHIVTLIFTLIYNSKASFNTTNWRCQIALDI